MKHNPVGLLEVIGCLLFLAKETGSRFESIVISSAVFTVKWAQKCNRNKNLNVTKAQFHSPFFIWDNRGDFDETNIWSSDRQTGLLQHLYIKLECNVFPEDKNYFWTVGENQFNYTQEKASCLLQTLNCKLHGNSPDVTNPMQPSDTQQKLSRCSLLPLISWILCGQQGYKIRNCAEQNVA